MMVCETITSSLKHNRKLSHYAKDFDNPIDCAWEFYHYFFVPVRIRYKTIPKDIQHNSLRKWLSIIFTIPFIENYSNKYITLERNILELDKFYTVLTNHPEKTDTFMKLEEKWIAMTIGKTFRQDNNSQVFIRVVMFLVLIISREILIKYCPCIQECLLHNASYDGSWLQVLDPLHRTQVDMINSLKELTKVSV
jgi:hypothetical protein